ncbi:MAG TPA: YtxH domain-containing protein [Thermomicrobiales bacterium]|nr:YtxH domain-containing protein [Thermomicrobiales bacterium]
MDNYTKPPTAHDNEEQDAFGKTWNDAEAFPQTQFNPVTDEFETVAEQPSPDEGGLGDKVSTIKDKAGQATETAKEKAGQATETAKEKASEVTDQAHTMSDKGIDSAATGLGQAASMLRQQGDTREGTIGTAATKTADTLEQASTYLQNKDTDQLITDLEAMVRQRPLESVLVAAGIGFVLSKIFS